MPAWRVVEAPPPAKRIGFESRSPISESSLASPGGGATARLCARLFQKSRWAPGTEIAIMLNVRASCDRSRGYLGVLHVVMSDTGALSHDLRRRPRPPVDPDERARAASRR